MPTSLFFMILVDCCAPWLRYCTSPCLFVYYIMPHFLEVHTWYYWYSGISILVKSICPYPDCPWPIQTIQKLFQSPFQTSYLPSRRSIGVAVRIGITAQGLVGGLCQLVAEGIKVCLLPSAADVKIGMAKIRIAAIALRGIS